jgi:very-short-patch-repair endonuclease
MNVDRAPEAVARLGGIARTRDLLETGIAIDAIRRAVLLRRTLVRPRRGIVALASTPPVVLRALAAGGALACVSAAEHYGFWTPGDQRLHLSVRSDTHTTSNPRVVLHRDAHHLRVDERFVASRESCVSQCIRELSFDDAIAVLDSALNQSLTGRAMPFELDALRRSLPGRLQSVIDAADARSEAGAESIACVRLRRLGLAVRPQVWVTRGVRCDLLIGDALIVEIGSREFHADPQQYEADHRRSTLLTGLGFDVVEFTTAQVMSDWPAVESAILARHYSAHSLEQRS